jgi:hypothetical protein
MERGGGESLRDRERKEVPWLLTCIVLGITEVMPKGSLRSSPIVISVLWSE